MQQPVMLTGQVNLLDFRLIEEHDLVSSNAAFVHGTFIRGAFILHSRQVTSRKFELLTMVPWFYTTRMCRRKYIFNNYKRRRYKAQDKVRLAAFRIEYQQAVETAKNILLTNLGNKVNNPATSQKSYWKIINRVMNKCSAPKIPPLVNNLFILNCGENARYFNDYFSQQCKPVINNSVLPILGIPTNKRIDHVTIENDELKGNIFRRNFRPNVNLCDDSITLPLQIIFTNILTTSIYPDMWKLLM